MFGAVDPSPLLLMPFGVLLAMIALAPLFFLHWWERYYPVVAIALGAVTVGYYAWASEKGLADDEIVHAAEHYLSFICLVGSLFVVSGGIHIRIKGEATPLANIVFLFVGAVIANVLGTTGASMLLIRPWIRMNKYRITGFHIVFFIFIVSNAGGCLTPIGDPPLFLGYLEGIPFWWVLANCWSMWLVGIGLLLGIFHVLDRRNYLRAPEVVRKALAEPRDSWHFDGLTNLVFLGVILGAVFLSPPDYPMFLREMLMVAAAAGSYFFTRESIHQANDFNFEPIREVAILFIGIFATMIPALAMVRSHAADMGGVSAGFFYWGTGSLSGILDNAPTYLCFLNASTGLFAQQEIVAGVRELLASAGQATITGDHAAHIRAVFESLGNMESVTDKDIRAAVEAPMILGDAVFNRYVVAISVSAVFFGAATYIGNGPNFMVKNIAEQQRVHVPSFLEYIFRYALPYLLPVVVILWLIFFL